MATRLYLNTNAEYIPQVYNPAFSGIWDITTGALVRRLEDTKQAVSPSTTYTVNKTATQPQNILLVQMIIPGLAAQTISGNLKGQWRMNESVATVDAGVQQIVRLYRPSTNTFIATLLANNNYGAISATPGAVGYELFTTLRNIKVPTGWSGTGQALTSQACNEGDMIVIEVGCRYFGTVTPGTVQIHGTEASASDMAEDETSGGSGNGWFEFSNTLTFARRGKAVVGQNAEAFLKYDIIGEIEPPDVLVAGQLWPRGAGNG